MKTLTDIHILQLMRQNELSSDALPEETVRRLRARGFKVAFAESCTGGLISERLTRVSGASAVFDCGVCSYANRIKEEVLGVQRETLETKGAVSAETAVQMAQGVRRLAHADIAVSVTGVAGPTGGTPEKPVGLVYLGVSAGTEAYAVKLMLGGRDKKHSRAEIRRIASDAALFTVWEACGPC